MTNDILSIKRESKEIEFHRTIQSEYHSGVRLGVLHDRRLIGYGVLSDLSPMTQSDRVIPLAALDVPRFFNRLAQPGLYLSTVDDGLKYIKALMSSVLFYDPDNVAGEIYMRELAAELTVSAISHFYDDIIFTARQTATRTEVYEVELGGLEDNAAIRVTKLPRTIMNAEKVDIERLRKMPLYDVNPSHLRYGFTFQVPIW